MRTLTDIWDDVISDIGTAFVELSRIRGTISAEQHDHAYRVLALMDTIAAQETSNSEYFAENPDDAAKSAPPNRAI